MHRHFFSVSFLLPGLLCANICFGAEAKLFQSGPDQAVLLELYTSEGCSSCPPAENWMSGLRSSPYLWTRIVPIAFHVDYWDYLGWKDALSSPEFSARQRSYAERWKSKRVYTPMIVTGGAESRDWYTTPALKIKGKKDAGTLKVEQMGEREFEITYLPYNNAVMERVSVNAAYLGCNILTRIGAGENQGKILRHDFAVLSLVQKELSYQNGVLKAYVEFERPQDPAIAPRHAISVWLTRPESAEPLQAAGGYLE